MITLLFVQMNKMKFRYKFSLVYISLSFCFLKSPHLYAQNTGSSINSESLLIDALKEEATGQPKKAIEILEKLKYEPGFKSVSYYLLSRLYFAEGRSHDALDAIHHSLTEEPQQKWYLLLNANIAESLGLYDEAATCYINLYKLEPNQYTFYDNAAYHYVNAGIYDKAFQVLVDAEHIFGLRPEIAIKKSFILGEQGKYAKGIELLERSLELHPNSQELLKQISSLLEKSQDNKLIQYVQSKYPSLKTISHQTSALVHNLDSLVNLPDAEVELVIREMINQLNQLTDKDSVRYYLLQNASNKLLSLHPKNIKVICLTADIHYLYNRADLALPLYLQAIKESSVPYSVWDNTLHSLMELGYWQATVQYANKCLDYFPNQTLPYYAICKSLIHLNKFQEVVSPLQQLELMLKHRKNQSPQVLLLKAQMLDGLNKESKDVWDQAMALDSSKIILLEKVVSACQRSKNHNESFKESELLNGWQDDFKTNVLMARWWLCNADAAKAKSCIDRAITLNDFKNFEFYLLASEIYQKSGLAEPANHFRKLANAMQESIKLP